MINLHIDQYWVDFEPLPINFTNQAEVVIRQEHKDKYWFISGGVLVPG